MVIYRAVSELVVSVIPVALVKEAEDAEGEHHDDRRNQNNILKELSKNNLSNLLKLMLCFW